MTALLAARSNRPEVSFASAAAGSIHPVHLLQFVFADLFGAMDPKIEYWAPQSAIWDAAWGWPGLYLSQNMGLVYAGALTVRRASSSFGLIRGLAWAREIRFFTIAAALVLLYALGALHAGLPPDVRHPARRGALSPAGRCHLRAGRAGRDHRRLSRPSLAHRHGAAGDARAARARDRLPDRADRRPRSRSRIRWSACGRRSFRW